MKSIKRYIYPGKRKNRDTVKPDSFICFLPLFPSATTVIQRHRVPLRRHSYGKLFHYHLDAACPRWHLLMPDHCYSQRAYLLSSVWLFRVGLLGICLDICSD